MGDEIRSVIRSTNPKYIIEQQEARLKETKNEIQLRSNYEIEGNNQYGRL
jgi:hypothetical protein